MSDIKTAESNNSAGKSSSGFQYKRQEINHVDPLFGAIQRLNPFKPLTN